MGHVINQTIAIEAMQAHPRNYQQHPESQIAELQASLRRFGQVRSVVAQDQSDGRFLMVAGHGILEAARREGWRELRADVIPCDWTPEQVTAYLVADNELAKQAEPDEVQLATLLQELEAAEWGLEGTGWDKDELEALIEELGLGEELPEDPGAQLDKAAELQENWGTALGQVWEIGEHRIVCGDCTDPAVVETVMAGERAALTLTSPPYWVGKEYETQKSVDEIWQFIMASAATIARFTREDESRVVINTSTGFTTSFDKRKKRQTLLLIDKWTNAFWDLGWNLRHVRHWLKQGQLASISAKADMIDQHCEWFGVYEFDDGREMVFDDRIDQSEVAALLTYYNARGRGRGRGQETLGNYYGAKHWALCSYWSDIPGAASQSGHCAAFPLLVVERHLLMYTTQGEIVLDPFLGSGTALIACERFKRFGRGVELEPKYVAVSLERLRGMGLQPRLVDG